MISENNMTPRPMKKVITEGCVIKPRSPVDHHGFIPWRTISKHSIDPKVFPAKGCKSWGIHPTHVHPSLDDNCYCSNPSVPMPCLHGPSVTPWSHRSPQEQILRCRVQSKYCVSTASATERCEMRYYIMQGKNLAQNVILNKS